MPIHEALGRLITDFHETRQANGAVAAHGSMRFGNALEGPPGRLHGGHHVFVRTLPILDRLAAHDDTRTFPCEVDVPMLASLDLDVDVPFEATYESNDAGWSLTSRYLETDRLLASAQSIPDAPLLNATEIAHWKRIYEESLPGDNFFEMHGVVFRISPQLLWTECHNPTETRPGSQHASLVEVDGTLGPAFICTQLDAVGASARGTLMRHPHFTKHIEIRFAKRRIPGDTHVLCLADKTRIEEDASSDSAPVEINEESYGTARIPVALVDAAFGEVFATGHVTAHPVDPAKFEALKRMRALRTDLK